MQQNAAHQRPPQRRNHMRQDQTCPTVSLERRARIRKSPLAAGVRRAMGIAAVGLACTALAGMARSQGTVRASVSTSGIQANNASDYFAHVSADGKWIAFHSDADNLVVGDSNGVRDAFLHELSTSQTMRISLSTSGGQANGASSPTWVTADASYVALQSHASNLFPNDTNGRPDVVLRHSATGSVVPVSVAMSGASGNGDSGDGAVSDDGRYVAFRSAASNLVPNDTNATFDIFVRDMQLSQTRRVSLSTSGVQGNGSSSFPSISSNGRYICFRSSASNLVPGDTNGVDDDFVHDMSTGITIRVNVDSQGNQANALSETPFISGDGRFVAFMSYATNLVPGDTNQRYDIFVKDLATQQTTRVNVSSSGTQANFNSNFPHISHDGRYVVFQSDASNLVPNDTNFENDAFIHDRLTGTTMRASVSSAGVEGNQRSEAPKVSRDGSVVAFISLASNLVPSDSNGVRDIFAHKFLMAYRDADVDSFGDPQASAPVTAPIIGYVGDSSDCDDTRANVYPGAPEVCDGLDNDCNGQVDEGTLIQSYCTPGTSTNGCRARLGSIGIPSATAGSGFTLIATQVEGQRMGYLYYGITGPQATPWGNSSSTLCIAPPRQRMAANSPTGGTAGLCNGVVAQDWNAYIATHPFALGQPFTVGRHVWAQAYYRDPPSPFTTNLSDGLHFVVCP